MSKAADWKKLGYALQHAEENQEPQSHLSILFTSAKLSVRTRLLARVRPAWEVNVPVCSNP
jgi:hypothetical protein